MSVVATARASRLRSRVDTIVFDMDGVLIEISGSIRQVNLIAPAAYLRTLPGWTASDRILTSADIEAYKHAGGFNDDWDLTCAVVLVFLARSARAGVRDADALADAPPSHAQVAEQIAGRGGGLAAAERILLDDPCSRIAPELYDRGRIGKVFRDYYAGNLSEQIYGEPARYKTGEGWIRRDRPILDRSLIPPGVRIGLLSGRSYGEMCVGRTLCGLESMLPDNACVTQSDGVYKPDPRGLAQLATRLGAECGLYIGDTLDDLRTVLNYRDDVSAHRAVGDRPGAEMLAALVLSGPMGAANAERFRTAGADILADDVNEVLRWIAQGRQ